MKSRPPDEEQLERRTDEARLRQLLGEPLSETDLRILQIEQNGFGCHTCAGAHRAGGVSMPGADIPKESAGPEESAA
ncbi:MAG TPA: hypothetical protein VF984_07100 [Actinomycetota bacterium]